jgi:hypothetical protein
MEQGGKVPAKIADPQRVQSKLKNQTTSKFNRANVKDNASDFLAQMDKIPCNDCWSSSTTTEMMFHVWTDVPTTLPLTGCNQNSKNHHVVIVEEDTSKLGQKRTLNHTSDSTPTISKKRRSSPLKINVDDDHHHNEDEEMQSLAVANTTTTTTSTTAGTFLCRNRFYKGKCANLKHRSENKPENCRHEHPVLGKLFQSLGHVLNQNHQNGVLDAAEAAMVEATRDETKKDLGGMETLHYFSIKLHEQVKEVANDDQKTLGQVFTSALRDWSCIDASLVYVACDHTLIFDRYQEGLLVTDLGSLLRDAKRSASNTKVKVSRGDDWARADCLPVVVLERILMYLPDASTATMSRVCSAWHNEIGNSSSSIWQQMMKRRKWPLANDPASSFKMHYEVVRDVAAVKDALSTLLNARQASASDDAEMVYQPFSTRHTPPSEPNSCIAMEVWSPGEVIAAFSPDCTIRLFKTVADGLTGGKTCREVISVCVNPFPNTSKLKDKLVAMALDSKRIGCLLDVNGDSPSFLSIILRDAFLKTAGGDSSSTAKAAECNSSSTVKPAGGYSSSTANAVGGNSSSSGLSEGEEDEDVLTVIDIREQVLDYIRQNDALTDRWAEVHDYDIDDFHEMGVIVSNTLVACGYGLFALEADLCIDRRVPNRHAEEDDDDDYDAEMSAVTLDHMIVVICASEECVTWMGALPLPSEISDYCKVTLAGSFIHRGQTTSYCIIAGASSSLCLSQAEINGSLEDVCKSVHLFDTSPGVSPEFGVSTQRGQWEIDGHERRRIVIYPGRCVVTVDVHVNRANSDDSFPSSCVSFFPCDDTVQPVVRENALHASSNKPLWLKSCRVVYVQRIREEHILLICEQVDAVDDSTIDDHDVVESGRGSVMAEKPREYIQGLVLHVPTRQVIERILFPFDMTSKAMQGLVMSSGNSTVGVGLSWKGIVLTGADIRAVGSGAIEL